MGVDKAKMTFSAIRRLKITRPGRYGQDLPPGILEVTHHHERTRPTPWNPDGEESWSCVIRDRDGKSKGGFELCKAEAILLANIITETRQESIDTWDVPSQGNAPQHPPAGPERQPAGQVRPRPRDPAGSGQLDDTARTGLTFCHGATT